MTEKEKTLSTLFKKGEEFLGLYQKVENFTKEILEENEKLRYRVAALEQENRDIKENLTANPAESLVEEIKRLEREKAELMARYRSTERENIDFTKRYLEIEAENNNLANLYVASYQLHSTLDFGEVLQIVKEIIINLIGAESFAIFLLNIRQKDLSIVATEGIEEETLKDLKDPEGIIARSLRLGHGVYVSPEPMPSGLDLSRPLVSIPLRIKEKPIGAIVIYKMLEQKKRFTPLDIELFNLLGGHAATSMFGARLYSDSKRKLTTIQGFLDLLKPE